MRRYLVGLWISSCASHAAAVQVFEFDYEGTAQGRMFPSFQIVEGVFTARARVELVDGGDGEYTGDQVILISAGGTVTGIPFYSGNGGGCFLTGRTPLQFPMNFRVSVLGGKLSFGANCTTNLQFGAFSVSDQMVSFIDYTPSRYDAISGNASVVPEPGTYALLLAGLGSLAFASRRRRGFLSQALD